MSLAPHRGALRALVLSAAVTPWGCASTQETQEELSRLRQELHTVRSELRDTRQTVDALSDRITLLAARPAPSAPNAPVTGLPVVRLERKKSPASEHAAGEESGEPILIKLGPEDSPERLPVDREVLSKPDPVLSARGARATEKTDYEAALKALRERAQPAEARALFTAFAAKYPKSELGDNVSYWLAECSFAEAQWARAISDFLALVEARPGSAKVPDALLRTAEAWMKLGKTKEAEDVLRRLIKNYPTSSAKSAAEQRLSELGAT